MEIANKLLSSDILNRFKGKPGSGSGPGNQPAPAKYGSERLEEREPDPFSSQKSGLGKPAHDEPKQRRFEEDDLSKHSKPLRKEWNQNSQSEYFDPASSNYASTYQKHRSDDNFEPASQKEERIHPEHHLARKYNPTTLNYGSEEEEEDRFDSGPKFVDGSRKEKFNREDYEINFNETSRVSSSQFSAFCPNDEMKSFFKKEFLDNHSQGKDKEGYHTIGELTNNSSKLTYGPNSIFLEKKLSGRSHQKEDI